MGNAGGTWKIGQLELIVKELNQKRKNKEK